MGWIQFSNTKGISMITMETVHEYTAVDRYNISLLDYIFTRKPMYHRLIDGNAKRIGVPVEILERRPAPQLMDKLLRHLIQGERGDSRTEMSSQFREGSRDRQGRSPDLFNLFFAINGDHENRGIRYELRRPPGDPKFCPISSIHHTGASKDGFQSAGVYPK